MNSNKINKTAMIVFGLALLAAAFSTKTVSAQTVLQCDETVDVDKLGNGTYVLDMSFNAQQFQGWQSKYGMNPSLLKREVGKTFTACDITDFQIEKNDLERTVKLTIKASGVTQNMGDGEINMHVPKQWRLVNQDDNELKFNYLESIGNGVSIQHHITVNLPKDVTDVTEPVPSIGGQNRVTYRQPVEGRSSMMLIFGLLLSVGGAGAMVVGFVKTK